MLELLLISMLGPRGPLYACHYCLDDTLASTCRRTKQNHSPTSFRSFCGDPCKIQHITGSSSQEGAAGRVSETSSAE
uniref:Putative secreted protein n=1 Tax=Anopheles marajoara TaxID=58244 RepID=A0A2M4CCJ9_9DIPT